MSLTRASCNLLGRLSRGALPAAPETHLAPLLASQKLGNQQTRSYDKKVIDHYENPQNVGSFDKKDPNVGTGVVGAPACGDVMKLQIRVDDDGNIVDSCFKTFGCGSAIASSSLATQMVKGMKVDEAVEIKNSDIAAELNLPPVKLHCSMLAEDAIKSAVKDLEKKKKAAMVHQDS
eukprot:scaffold700_cov560-Prasinococcus_capsulatus_cf.AAC.6